MPHLIYKAAARHKITSNTRYIQLALCDALSRDLGIPVEELIAALPPPRGAATVLSDRRPPDRGRDFVIEQVK
jgi:hypothetical protein